MSFIGVVFDGILDAIHTLVHGRPFTREVVAKGLDEAAAKKGEKLNWRTSVVDLMKTLDRDSSLGARIDLADELGYEGIYTGTAEQNTWLVEKVLAELANHYIDMPGQVNKTS